jgi:3-oxoadipate enol-lactonase
MPFVQSNGARIHYKVQGEGTPVLLIMGHRYSSKMWWPLLPELVKRHRVITFDNRGTGESDVKPGFSLKQMAADGLAVMDAAGVERAHVYGVSMGGGIAAELAVQAPQRVISLVLGCTALWSAEKPRMPAWMRMLYYLPPKLLALILGKRDGYGSAAPADLRAKDEAQIAADVYSTRGVAAQAKAIAGHVATVESIAALSMPTLVLHGDEDTLVPLKYGEEFHRVIPGSRMVTFQGAAHNYLIARLPESTAAVMDFFDEADGRT